MWLHIFVGFSVTWIRRLEIFQGKGFATYCNLDWVVIAVAASLGIHTVGRYMVLVSEPKLMNEVLHIHP